MPGPPFSELVLSDRLITLAEDAERAGYKDTAERLVTLACSVFDEKRNSRSRTDWLWPARIVGHPLPRDP